MRKVPDWLLDFRADVYSQTGEDGIIGKILELLPDRDYWCVEFGAWDGVFLSNVRNLIEQAGYSAILIEASKDKYAELVRTYAQYEKVICVNKCVGFSDEDGLDGILKGTPIPRDFDFLSIDVDGNDYHIWQAISEYRSKVVCIEFNPTIPSEVRFVQEPDPSVNQGASLLALVELGKEKGYELISVLPFNAFFVKSEYFGLFEIEDNSPAVLRKTLDYVTFLFSGYDGKIFLRGNGTLPWHRVEIRESRIQRLPAVLRKYPGKYTKMEQRLLGAWKVLLKANDAVGKLVRGRGRRWV